MLTELKQWFRGSCYFGADAAGVALKLFCCGDGGIETRVMLKHGSIVPVTLPCFCSSVVVLQCCCYHVIPRVLLPQQNSVVATALW